MGQTEWMTPRDFYDAYDSQFHFELDAASTHMNHLCPIYCTVNGTFSDEPDLDTHSYELTDPVTGMGEDGLLFDWAPYRTFLNPPYSPGPELYRWVEKAALTGVLGGFVFALLPPFTDNGWFHDFIWDVDKLDWRPGVRGNFLKGRLKFIDPTPAKRSAPRSGNLVVTFGQP